MDDTRFDALTKTLVTGAVTRRRALTLVAGTALGGLMARLGLGADAAEAAACRRVGERCRRPANCCSGVCRGPEGKKTCRAHDVGTCRPELEFCLTDAECNGRNCICLTTTGGALFCGLPGGECTVCERDRDCLRLGFPSGSACVRLNGGRCAGACIETGGAACFAPCGPAIPAPEGLAPAGRGGPVPAPDGER